MQSEWDCDCDVIDNGCPEHPVLDWDLVKTMADMLAMSIQLLDDDILLPEYNRLCHCCNPKAEGKDYHAV